MVRLAHLYQFKFGEHFEKYQDVYFQKVWEIVANNKLSADRECERLVFAVVRYLGEAAGLPNYRDFIKSNLQLLFQVLVIPNISLTQQDIDEYEDEPHVYLRNDLEESDSETRRRHCMKFVQQLSKKFQNEVGTLIGEFFTQFQQEYEQNKAQ